MTHLDLRRTSDLLRLLADPSRMRLLELLSEEELSVAELQAVTNLSQSRVSSHLGRLRESGWVVDRKDGASTFYRLDERGMEGAARAAWALLRPRLRDAVLERDRRRLAEVLAERRGRATTWADAVAGRMDRHYAPGRTWQATAWGLLGFCALRDVLDVASGDGVLAQLLAPRARRVTCLDVSRRVVRAGRRRLRVLANVRFVRGDMHALPFADGSHDQVLLMNALQYAVDPARVVAEAARVLRPGGALAGSAIRRHRHRDTRDRYDHRNWGFEPDEVREALVRAGLEVEFVGVTTRERRPPHHEIVTFHARARGGAGCGE